MAVALGVGLFICAFQALAIFGAFKMGATVALVVAGFVAAAIQLPSWPRVRRALRANEPAAPWTYFERVAMIALALVALPALVAPLAPPIAFDELMYHLPYARQVAQQARWASTTGCATPGSRTTTTCSTPPHCRSATTCCRTSSMHWRARCRW